MKTLNDIVPSISKKTGVSEKEVKAISILAFKMLKNEMMLGSSAKINFTGLGRFKYRYGNRHSIKRYVINALNHALDKSQYGYESYKNRALLFEALLNTVENLNNDAAKRLEKRKEFRIINQSNKQ